MTALSPSSYNEQLAALRLYRTRHVGPITYYELMRVFGTPLRAMEALPELTARGGKALTIHDEKKAKEELDTLGTLGGRLMLCTDTDWPSALSFEDAPPLLLALGNIGLLERPAVGIVGTRDATVNGLRVAREISEELAANGWLVVSGMARGIDSAAHEGALLEGTAAVLASGVDVAYPEENTVLYEKIIATGIALSEAPLGQQALQRYFPRRNRIISGLSRGVVIVEAALKSGSLITAEYANEQGREVMAVPGSPLDPRAKGSNQLLRDGAAIVESGQDVLSVLHHARSDREGSLKEWHKSLGAAADAPLLPPEDERAKVRTQIRSLLGANEVWLSDLVSTSGLPSRTVYIALLELELAGVVSRLSGDKVIARVGTETSETDTAQALTVS